MGILEYLWPFEKRFSEIPCARESAIAGLIGGPGLGAASIIIFNSPRRATKIAIWSGFVIFWGTFISCQMEQRRMKRLSDQFLEACSSADLDADSTQLEK